MAGFAYGRVAYEEIDRNSARECYRKIRRTDTLENAKHRCEELASHEGKPITKWGWSPMDGMWLGTTDAADTDWTADGWYVQEA